MTRAKFQDPTTSEIIDVIIFATRKAADKYISKKEGRKIIFFSSHKYYTSI